MKTFRRNHEIFQVLWGFALSLPLLWKKKKNSVNKEVNTGFLTFKDPLVSDPEYQGLVAIF